MSRCTPTGLQHAGSAVNQSKSRRLARDDGARAISLGSCEFLESVEALTSVKGRLEAGGDPLSVIPRCAPSDLVRLWCAHSSYILRAIYRFCAP